MRERLVIIGGVAAGMSAAAKARRVNPELEIVVYERSGYVSYGACGFPYFIKGEVDRLEALLARTPAQLAQQDIDVHVHHDVVAIDVAARTVRVCNLETGQTFVTPWDKLIIATGASVKRPPIPGIQLPGIFTLRTVEDALAIRNWIQRERPRRGVIIGAGYIGMEMAEALSAHGMEVTVVDLAQQVMPSLDEEMATLVQAELAANGVNVCLGQGVKSFLGPGLVRSLAWQVAARLRGETTAILEGDNGRLRVRELIMEEEMLPADLVIASLGTSPNVQLAGEAGIALGKTGAIAVDAQQRTNAPGVWAAGAAAESRHQLLQTAAYSPTALTASKQGRVAGTNAAGGEARFGGVVGTAVVKTFTLTVAQTGLTLRAAQAHGLDAASVTISGGSRASYMPGQAEIRVKLVFERHSRRLLGAQMIGKDGVAKRIDVVAAALRAGWTTRDLLDLDLCYSPPFAPVWEPLLVAAKVANREDHV